MRLPSIRTTPLGPLSIAVLALTSAACGRGSDSGAAAAAPTRAGLVWEADHVEDRANAPATLLAFVNGLHVVVLDGDDAYAGMTRLHVAPSSDGERTIPLTNGLGAALVPVGDVMELRFSTGESLSLRKQPAR